MNEDIKKELDKEFSLAVKYRDMWMCKLCGKVYYAGDPDLECSHFRRRKNYQYRWDFDNAVSLCKYDCHKKIDADPKAYEKFKITMLGEDKVNEMNLNSKKIFKYNNINYEELLGEIRTRLVEEIYRYEKLCSRY